MKNLPDLLQSESHLCRVCFLRIGRTCATGFCPFLSKGRKGDSVWRCVAVSLFGGERDDRSNEGIVGGTQLACGLLLARGKSSGGWPSSTRMLPCPSRWKCVRIVCSISGRGPQFCRSSFAMDRHPGNLAVSWRSGCNVPVTWWKGWPFIRWRADWRGLFLDHFTQAGDSSILRHLTLDEMAARVGTTARNGLPRLV